MNYLVIGNSRWHWARKNDTKWTFFHTEATESERLNVDIPLKAWAAVGKIPQSIFLKPCLRLKIDEVPLLKLPPWIGIDRALAGWAAFKRMKAQAKHPNGLLVADAGTVFSITRVKGNGEFAGGKLMAGLNLQLKAMAQGTRNLKEPEEIFAPKEPFPINTEEAMLRGIIDGFIGALTEAHIQTNFPIWLCGGNASIINKELKHRNIEVMHYPNLVLEGMIDLTS